jgi:hypothetical protein
MRRAAWKNAALAVALGSASVGAIANPYDWSVRALVTGIEVTYVPNEILFSLDASAGPCAAGSWLRYLPFGGGGGVKGE